MATIRVRHYTRRNTKEKILAEQRIIARDQNKVFLELARTKPGSPVSVEARYRLKPGKAAAYIEFDADASEIASQLNPRTGKSELFIVGDVDLTNRNAKGFDNN